MNRIEFMEKLEYLLQDIPDEEKTDALAYYQDYLEEAGDENEEQAIREFGSPERIAAMIRSELSGNLEDGGGFTETGYQDERFREPGYQVAPHRDLNDPDEASDAGEHHDPKPHHRRRDDSLPVRLLKIACFLILLSILGPIALGAGGAALSVVAVLVIVLIVLFLTVGFGTLLFCLAAVGMTIYGIACLFVSPPTGMAFLGLGIFLLGCSFIGVVLSTLVYGRMVPFFIRGITDGISRVLHRNRRRPR